MGSCGTKIQHDKPYATVRCGKLSDIKLKHSKSYVTVTGERKKNQNLPNTRLDTDKSAHKKKQKILKCPMKEIAQNVFTETKAERKQLWNEIDGDKGAHLLSFHFYRRIYANDLNSNQQNVEIKQFCSLFTDRPFAQAVDRVKRFMSAELNGKASFWNMQWVDNVHCSHTEAKYIISPLSAQMWYSFLCSALTDLEWTKNTKKRILTFFKDSMVFLFMDTWMECKGKLIAVPVQGLVQESNESIGFWEKQYIDKI